MATMRSPRLELPADLVKDLENLTKNVRNKLLRKGLRQWSNFVKTMVKTNLTADDSQIKRNVKVKVKSYRRGSKIWVGIGVTDNGTAPNTNPGLRVAMYEGGWRPWPKGRKSGKKGRGWRKGLRRVVSPVKVWATHFMSRTQEQTKSSIIPNIIDAVREGIKESTK